MSIKQQRLASVTQLGEQLEGVAEIKLAELPRKDVLGTALSFIDAVPYVERVYSLLLELKDLDITPLPDASLTTINGIAVHWLAKIVAINSFKAEQGNAASVRNQMLAAIKSESDKHVALLMPFVSFIRSRSFDVSETKKQITKQVNEVKDGLDGQLGVAESKLDELDLLVKSAKEATAGLGVATNSIVFAEEAVKHNEAAVVWLKWTLVTVMVALAYAIYVVVSSGGMIDTPSTTSTTSTTDISDKLLEHAIHGLFPKLILMSILLGITTWCGKNYRSHKHNEVKNRQKQIALSTFETFSGGARDPVVKDAVLMRATEAIFNHGDTGYSTSDSTSENSSQVFELFRGSSMKNNSD